MSVLLLTGLLLTACGDKEEPEQTTPPPQKETVTEATPTPEPTSTPEPEVVELEGGGSYIIVATGEGDQVAEGMFPVFDLTVQTLDGNDVWSGQMGFRIGSGQGHPDIDSAVRGMKPGEKREIRLPRGAAEHFQGINLRKNTELKATAELLRFEETPKNSEQE